MPPFESVEKGGGAVGEARDDVLANDEVEDAGDSAVDVLELVGGGLVLELGRTGELEVTGGGEGPGGDDVGDGVAKVVGAADGIEASVAGVLVGTEEGEVGFGASVAKVVSAMIESTTVVTIPTDVEEVML